MNIYLGVEWMDSTFYLSKLIFMSQVNAWLSLLN